MLTGPFECCSQTLNAKQTGKAGSATHHRPGSSQCGCSWTLLARQVTLWSSAGAAWLPGPRVRRQRCAGTAPDAGLLRLPAERQPCRWAARPWRSGRSASRSPGTSSALPSGPCDSKICLSATPTINGMKVPRLPLLCSMCQAAEALLWQG